MKNYTASEINRLKQDAKKLRRSDPALKHVDALNAIAQREGWPTWSALHSGATAPSFSESLKFLIRPISHGQRGAFALTLSIDASRFRPSMATGGLSFELPKFPVDWGLRMANGTIYVQDISSFRSVSRSVVGTFVEGKFECSIFVHKAGSGAFEWKVAQQLLPMCAQIREAVNVASENWLPNPTEESKARLFFSLPREKGRQTLQEQTFSTLEDAQNATLDPEAIRVGISDADGWWFHSLYGGWKKHYGWPEDDVAI